MNGWCDTPTWRKRTELLDFAEEENEQFSSPPCDWKLTERLNSLFEEKPAMACSKAQWLCQAHLCEMLYYSGAFASDFDVELKLLVSSSQTLRVAISHASFEISPFPGHSLRGSMQHPSPRPMGDSTFENCSGHQQLRIFDIQNFWCWVPKPSGEHSWNFLWSLAIENFWRTKFLMLCAPDNWVESFSRQVT